MNRKPWVQILILAALLILIVAGCRRAPEVAPADSETATAIPATEVPASEVPETEGEETQPPAATATEVPEAEAPEAEAIAAEAIDWPPQLVGSEPAPNETIDPAAEVTLRFDRAMDQSSVESAWDIEPAVSGSFTWPRPDTMVFTPQEALERGQSYRVQIGESAAAQDGIALKQAVSFALQTAGPLQVAQVVPADGTENVQANGAITVVFDQPVVPVVSSGEQASLPQPLTISPEVEGEGRWVSTSIYRFEPAPAFAGATNYEVTVDEGLEAVSGATLPGSFSWQFSTESPKVVSSIPANGAVQVVPTDTITLTFNMPMDVPSTEAALSLVPAAPVTLAWEENDSVLLVSPEEPLALDTTFDLTIGTGATAATGNASLVDAFTSSFTTVPLPGIVETQPAPNTVVEPWQYGLWVRFASPMDFSTLEDQIVIEPAPDEEVEYFYNEYIDELNPANSNFSLSLNFDLERDTQYTVTIPASAADPYGNTLGEDYVWQFTTSSFSPVASFNLTKQATQLTTSFPSNVEVIHRNVSELNVALTDIGLPLELIGNSYNVMEYAPPGQPLRTWDIPVETAQDEVSVTTVQLADGEVLPTGVYLLSVSAPETDENARYWQTQRVILVVADTNLVVRHMPDEVHVWATDLESGEPMSGLDVALFTRSGAAAGTAVTDSNGFARFEAPESDEYYMDALTAVSSTPGEEGFGVANTSWTGDINPWQLGIEYGWGPPIEQFGYLYTDRPIYRPGDTVYFKGIFRESNFGRYGLPEAQTLELFLSTNFYMESGMFEDQFEVEVDERGIFYGEYELPDDIALGSYRIDVRQEGIDLARTFSVAEYRRPEFLVTLAAEQEEALRGEQVDVTLTTEYFFGGNPEGLNVNWTLYEMLYEPEMPGQPYSFSDQADFNYEQPGPFGFGGGGGTFGRYLDGGNGVTDANGQVVITLPSDLLADIEEGSRRVTVEATVTDISNLPITSNTSVIFHSANVYGGIRPADYVSPVGEEAAVDLISLDWEGERVANQDIEIVFYARDWERSRESEIGMYYTAWTPIDTEVARTTVTTNEQGVATAGFVPENAGAHIAVATITDDAGNTQLSSTYLWIIDEDFAGWRTDPRMRTMELIPEQQTYNVGETARILVQSPFSETVNAWLTIERGNLLEQRVIQLEGGSTVLELPVTSSFAPNVFVSVVAIKPVTPDAEFPYADIRLGLTELRVPPDELALNVALTPREDLFEPGDTATYDVLITDHAGNPVSADFSLALVDLAVLTLKEDNAPPILEAFYSPQPYRSQVGSGLFVSGEGLEVEVPLEGGGGGGGGGGDMAESAIGLLDEEETRRDFPDTAYWEASVTTDANGEATVEIPLPDTLTTWRLSSKAVTEDTLVGQNSADVVVTLPLLIRPITPRFFTVGDVVQLGAIINNNTDESIEATASLEAAGLVLSGDAEQTVTVGPGDQERVRWEVTVEDVPFADLTFRVEGGAYSDATKPPLGVGPDNAIPVYRYTGRDFAGTSGELDEAGRRVEAVVLPDNADTSRGSVEVQMSASLAAALTEALAVQQNDLLEPSCAHSAANRLLPNVATAQAVENLGLEQPQILEEAAGVIAQDIATIESTIMRNGGWGWCFSEKTDPWISAYVLFSLTKAQQAGYEVDEEVLQRGTGFVQRQLEDAEDITDAPAANRQAFFLYVLSEAEADVIEDVDGLVETHRGLLDPYAKALMVLAYENLGSGGDNEQTLLADLNDEAIVSASGAHWEDAEPDFLNLSSDVRGTAMVVEALVRADPDSSLLAPAVRWLMLAREALVWSTPHETAWSIYALTNFMVETGELQADYSYELTVNTTSLVDGTFSSENILEQEELSVPVSNLLPDETNYFLFDRGEGEGRLYYTLFLNSFIDANSIEPTDRGVSVQRAYYDAACEPEEEACEPLESFDVGQQIRVELTVIAPTDLIYAVVRDPLPAGAEAQDPGLATTASGLEGSVERVDEFLPGYWGWWYFNRVEYRDEEVVFLADFLPAGTYQYSYYLQPYLPGEYQTMPTVAYQEFFPDVFGRSAGTVLSFTEE